MSTDLRLAPGTSQEKPRPRLSIIVATWNASRTFERCMLSVLGQSFKGWELLISDGGSTDGTLELIRQYEPHIAWWRSGVDEGIYDAWNQALTHASGDYVCFLGADDAWADNDSLERLFSKIGTQQYDLVTSRGVFFSATTGKDRALGGPWDYRRLGRRMVVCHPGMLHRQGIFETYGMFNTQYRIAGDLEFLMRLPPDLMTLDAPYITVRIGVGGISRRNFYARLLEQRDILAHSSRFGIFRAYLVWLDRLWRYPVARILNIPY